MATHIGNEGQVKIGTSTAIAEVTSFSVTETGVVADDSELADTADTHIPGSTAWTAEIECNWDETDTSGQGALRAGAAVALKLYPEGSTTGDKFYSGNATVTSFSVSVGRNATTKASFSCVGNGALSFPTV